MEENRTLVPGHWIEMLTTCNFPQSGVSSFRQMTIFRPDHPTSRVQPKRNVVASELKLP
jgi:hypothetical protein